MLASSSPSTQELAVTILPNGHNTTASRTPPYTLSGYHHDGAAMLLAAAVLALAAVAILIQLISYGRWRGAGGSHRLPR
jgi:hypothetical protein